MAFALCFIRAAIGFSLVELFRAMRAGAVATVCTAVPAASVLFVNGTLSEVGLAPAAAAGVAALAGWVMALLLLEHPLAGELQRAIRSARRLLPAILSRPGASLAD